MQAAAYVWEGRVVEGMGGSLPGWADVFNEEMGDFWGGEVIWNQPMAEYTTYKIGGPAEGMAFPCGLNEMAMLVKGLRRLDLPWRIIGGGSNILVADEGLPGMTIVFNKGFSRIAVLREVENRVYVRVQAGCSLARFVSWCREQGLAGMEFAAGIPGTVGGALRMNAGAWSSDISKVVTALTIMDEKGGYCVKGRNEVDFTYRSWGEDDHNLAMEGVFLLQRCSRETVASRCRENIARRKLSQPYGLASCGSFFKNPPTGKSAGQLIEEAGLKGTQVGKAMVSEQHANFLVNIGDATAHEMVQLMQLVQSEVKEKFGIFLEPEVRLLGFRPQV